MGQSLVTSRNLQGEFQTTQTLCRLIDGIIIKKTSFRSILIVDNDKIDSLELSKKIIEECYFDIGKAVPILEEVSSNFDDIKHCAVKVGLSHIPKGDSFSLRINKRGSHSLDKPTSDLESDIGGSIYDALEKKHNRTPRVNLNDPDVKVIVEILGPKSIIGIVRKEWLE